MIFRLKTSKKTLEIFNDLERRTNLKPFILSKLAIALSINYSSNIDEYESDNNGMELNRQTITGQYDILYKCLIEQQCGRHLPDEEYFPKYTKKHLDRGAELLEQEFKFTGNYEKFLIHLTRLEEAL